MSILDINSLSATQCALGVCGAALTLHFSLKTLRRRQVPLPPGPKPLPILGNLLDMPKPGDREGEFWAKHKALYGPISSVSALGQTIVIVNDHKIALDLLEKRSSIYSDRPVMTFAGEMIGLEVVTTLLRYNDTLKLHRKWFHTYVGTRAAMSQHEILEEIEARRFLLRVLDDPEDLLHHVRTLPGAVILILSHGYSIDNAGLDPLIQSADHVIGTIFSEAVQAGRWFVDTISALKYVPTWMPGAGFKRKARQWHKDTQDFYNKPYNFVKHEIASGNAMPSFTADLLEAGVDKEYGDDMVKHIAATMYGAGADTTVISLQTFFLAMTLYPDVFKRAQDEVDRVVGHDRLPSYSDRPNLPYIDAIIKETLRWKNVLPTGVPHVSTEEDVYMGYRIPKGALIVPVQWQMAHDPDNYNEPHEFKPERFLEVDGRKPELDPRAIIFGFGRRICPGRELAESTMFIAIAMTASAFNISKAKDEFGREIEVVNEFTSGLISEPKPFKCSIKPRSDQSAVLIRSVLEEHPFKTEDSKVLRKM